MSKNNPASPDLLDPHEITITVQAAFPGAAVACHQIGPDWVLARSSPEAGSVRPGGFISGPTQFALADSALWYLTFVAIGKIELMALTSELSIRFLRPAVGETLWARATLEKAGRRSVVGTVRLWTDDNESKPTATAQGTYMLPG
jgi:uncharacterized protein (TIGR00369 family)